MARKGLSILMLLASLAVVFVLGSAATAQTYPPAPPERPAAKVVPRTSTKAPLVVRQRVVRQTDGGVLSRTGTSTTLPLLIVGTGLAILGVTLVAVTRRRAQPGVRASLPD